MTQIFVVLTIALWGVGAFLGKTVLKEERAISTYLWEAMGTLTIALLVSLYCKKEFLFVLSSFNWWGYLFGILWGIGTVTFIIALKSAPASIVLPLTSLYPLITALLAIFFLNEPLTIKTGTGIVLAVLAAVLLI